MKIASLVVLFLSIVRRRFLLGLFVGLLSTAPLLASPQTVEWIRQLGTGNRDIGYDLSVDSFGGIYISGWSWGNFGGTSSGSTGAFISKCDASGTLLWTRQFGAGESYCLSTDDLGNVYASGFTSENLGGVNAGSPDAFIRKYSTVGTLLWTEQLGTSGRDYGRGVSSDSLGNVYITGDTEGSLEGLSAGGKDVFLCKYDALGTLLWEEQFGTSRDDYSNEVMVDSLGDVYIAGATYGDLGEESAGDADAIISKYDASGGLLWTKQFGTDRLDTAGPISIDSFGNVYVAGNTDGSLEGMNAGNSDVFIRKYDASGMLLWTEQFGTNRSDGIGGTSIDSLGNFYIAGRTEGSLGGPNAGGEDVFIRKYDTSGALLWTEQFGTSGDDSISEISIDGLDNLYFMGYTEGNLGEDDFGDYDVFVGKITDVPEPSVLLMLILGIVAFAVCRRFL